MKRYDEIKEELGPEPVIIPKITKYRSYKDGNFLVFDSLDEATKHSILNERFVENEEEFSFSDKVHTGWIKRVNNAWYDELRNEYGHMSDVVFKLCYDKAYEDGHSYGYDNVANKMIGFVEFAEDIIKATK